MRERRPGFLFLVFLAGRWGFLCRKAHTAAGRHRPAAHPLGVLVGFHSSL